MPRITVVLPVYNHAAYVAQTLHSLFAQDYRDVQIVAVDDGSTDSSMDILNRYRSRLRILEIAHQGPAAARNRALDASDSEFVAFMDADDLCAPDRLRVQLQHLQREGLDFVASALSFIDSSGQALEGEWRCPPGAGANYWPALLDRNWIGTPSVMLRRRALERSGAFDERFTHAEDYDLWLRIGQSHGMGYIDRPLIQCRRHAGNTSIDIARHQHFETLALGKVDAGAARKAFARLYEGAERRDEAWVWFLLRSASPDFDEELDLALQRHPESHPLHFARGVAQYDRGDWAGALATFSASPLHDTASRHNAGVLAALCGDSQTAEIHFNAVLQERPGYHDARLNLEALRHGLKFRLTRRPFRESLIPMVGVESKETAGAM